MGDDNDATHGHAGKLGCAGVGAGGKDFASERGEPKKHDKRRRDGERDQEER